MKRFAIAFSLLIALALPAVAQQHSMGGGKVGVTKSVSGEVVDMGCYLGHGARGEKHISCATKCINNGMPMGLLTSNGTLYLLTLNHDNADPYNQLKTMAGKNVTVTGQMMTRNGIKAIDVSTAQLASR